MSTLACPAASRLSGLLGLLLAGTAHAQLGGDAASIAADAQSFSTMGVRQTVGTLVRYELKTPTTTIHEYLGSSGQVYAVSFSGGNTPNLDLLLGGYAAVFNANVRHDRRSAHVDTSALKAVLQGHPGAISGVIWVPGLVPPGVNTGAL